jgi:hypothetical protein
MSDVAPVPLRPDAPDFFHGGALYRVMRRFGVEPEHALHAARRGVIAALILWAPMAVAALAEGVALPGHVRHPFLLDVAAYVRPLVAVPLLLVAEPILALAWRGAGSRLCERGIVVPECRVAYDALVDRITRSTRRMLPEVLCFAIAVALSARLVAFVLSAPRDTWFAIGAPPEPTRLTVAGAWAGWAVHAVLFYLSLRWLWLLSLWYRFLFGVSRLPIRLYPAHPDRAAGLWFLGWSIGACAPLIFAWSASISSVAANQMIHSGERLASFAPIGVAYLVFVLVVFVVPPVVIFGPLLARTRRRALDEWSRRMARRAEEVRTGTPSSPAGAAGEGADASSLEDLDIAVSAVRAIRPMPFAPSQLVGPLLAAAIPAVPLLFIAFPAREVFDQLLRILM